jgi:hypothetical protein
MHPELEKKIQLFMDEQMRLMEKFMGPFALQYKSDFGDNTGAYFKWLNMAYQLKSRIPSIDDQKLTPEALSKPFGKSPGLKF